MARACFCLACCLEMPQPRLQGSRANSLFSSKRNYLVQFLRPAMAPGKRKAVRDGSSRNAHQNLAAKGSSAAATDVVRPAKKRKTNVRYLLQDFGTYTDDAQQASEPPSSIRITRNMTTDGPRQAVFKTAELLENILLHLPAVKIFGVQRVCRQFRDVVATSAVIRQKLFLQPSGERQTWFARTDQHHAGYYTDSDFPPADAYFATSDTIGAGGNHKTTTPARLNPLLESGTFIDRHANVKHSKTVRRQPQTYLACILKKVQLCGRDGSPLLRERGLAQPSA